MPWEPSPADASGSSLDAAISEDAAPDVPDAGTSPACVPAASLLCSPLGPLPLALRETGFLSTSGSFDDVSPQVHPFAPTIQLWSDGLQKRRALFLPPGTKIDVSSRDAWVFPIGTIAVKTFFAEGPNGMKPVETRFIRRTDNPDPFEQYTFDVYKWNEAGTDATLLNIHERTPTPVTIAGRSHTHQIPSRADCKKCHETNDTMIIGFDEVRLNGAEANDGSNLLQAFSEAGLFQGSLPSPPAQITDSDPLVQRVKRYVYGNCYHCHNGNDSQAFDMNPDSFVDTVVGRPTEGSGIAPGVRIVPGNPEMSVLYRQMARTNLAEGYKPMPPVGVQVADPEGLQLVREWIMSLQ